MAGRRRLSGGKTRTARFGVYLDRVTREKLVIQAVKEGTSATELVERLIKDYLRKGPKG
jgi:hypothetical protein